jgi:hypothetical protein
MVNLKGSRAMHYFHPLKITPDRANSIQLPNHLQSRTAVRSESPFPPVDTHLLRSSSQKMSDLTKQASLLVDKINNSTDFAYELMEAAQSSNNEKAHALIKSTGITSKVKVKYSPTGIHLEFDNAEMPGRCCKLNMSLQW